MLLRCLSVILLATAVCGCASSSTKPPAQAAAPQPTTPPTSTYNSMRSVDFSSGGLAPPMTGARKINEQDCRQDIDLTAGNLRCR
jgi:hypothetical protein